ncbi:MAG: SxtJ family membrane protein [Planctomycetaceae bacterium]
MKLPLPILRKFGLVVGGIFAGLGAFFLLRSSGASWGGRTCAVLGALLLLGGTLAPAALAPVYRAWMVLGHALGWVNSRIILGVLFYVFFSLGRLYLILTRKDPMCRKWEPQASTYWIELEQAPFAPASLEHPF